jgi:hypothetical protein
MVKSLIKILIAVLLANALWRIASAYISYYKFQDAVQEYSIRTSGKNEEQIKSRIAELASQYEEPIDSDAVTVRIAEQHTYIEATYTKPVAVLPGYEYQWPFSLKVDGYVINAAR